MLYHFVECNWTYEESIDWAYSRYTDSGAPKWIEDFTLAYDVKEILCIIRDNFNFVNGKLTVDLEVGSIASAYFKGGSSIHTVVSELYELICTGKSEHSMKSDIYLADDYFDWSDDAETLAKELLESKLKEYLPLYAELGAKLNA